MPPLKLPDFLGLDPATAVDALFRAYVTLSVIADRPLAEEGLSDVVDERIMAELGFEPHEMVSMDRDGTIGLARDTRDQIVALIRQSRGLPANQNGCG